MDHSTLLAKLKRIGIRGKVLKLFNSYLADREQKTKKQDNISKSECVECDGTVPDPVLCLIYVNSLTKATGKGNVICFSGDTALLILDRTWQRVFEWCERAKAKLNHWLDSNLLTLNTDKTFFHVFAMTTRGLPDMDSLISHKYDCRRDASCKCTG